MGSKHFEYFTVDHPLNFRCPALKNLKFAAYRKHNVLNLNILTFVVETKRALILLSLLNFIFNLINKVERMNGLVVNFKIQHFELAANLLVVVGDDILQLLLFGCELLEDELEIGDE